ncbi:YdjY domain-containing protein [Bacillus piscicola]|uniref:YdjY domain-containing protein n=1 Tax=Bacillus piscicola TaxID=1632684 RepID=UPI001F093F93|nr:YdjY domain-containing protein [Bacillus piscicola]
MKSTKYFVFAAFVLLLLAAAGCSSTTEIDEDNLDEAYATSEEELGEDKGIYIDEENNTVKVYATVNGKYLVEPTRHGLNWIGGKYGDQAVFKGYANPLSFYEALETIGGEPATAKGENSEDGFKETDEGKVIQGDPVDVSITWEGAGKDYDINEVMVDSTGKEIAYRYGGNYDNAKEMMTGCFMCFDSCPVGITSNASHPVDTFEDGEAEFHGDADVLPEDGTPVVLSYTFAK